MRFFRLILHRRWVWAILASTILAATSLGVAGGSAAATPEPYPPTTPCAVSIAPDSLYPGETATVSASGLTPDTTATVTLHSTQVTLATVRSDSLGAIRVVVHVPGDLAPGKHTLIVTTSGVTCSLSTVVRVKPGDGVDATSTHSADSTSTSGGDSGLASTGVQAATIFAGGLVLLVVGTLLVLAARRRRHG
jgi:hypothetical protein